MSKAAALPGTTIQRLLVAALGCAIATVIVFRTIASDPLSRVGHNRRVIEARVSAFGYSTFHVLRSGESVVGGPAIRALDELERRLSQDRSAENLRRLADARLAVGEARTALPLLEEATRIQSGNVTALSDLAAAELTLGRVADAAEHAARALDIDPHQESAAFNSALALDELANRPAAIEAWRRYLDIDANSGWSAEAQRHLAALRAPRATYEKERNLLSAGVERATIERVTRQYPQRARARAHNVLLPEWVESGRADVLIALRAIAETRARDGDPYLRDIVDHAATHRSEIATGVRTYANARTSEKAGDWDVAGRRFSEAAELLRRAGSPLTIGAEVYAASSEMSAGHNERALERARLIQERLSAMGDRYPAVASEAAWIRGLIHARAGATNEALEAYQYALAQARRSGEIEHEAAIAELVASREAAVGEIEEADRLRLRVLQRLDQIAAEPLRLYVAYEEMAFTSLRASRPHLSLAFAEAASGLAEQSGDALQLAESAERRALALRDLGRQEEAIAAIASARMHAMSVIDQGARDRVLGEIDYTTGRIEMPRRPDRALAVYGSALEIWNRYGWRNHTASGLRARAEAALAIGDRVGAERDFRAGLEEIERQRTHIDEPVLRIAYFERSDSLFDQLITLLLDEGRSADALSIVERKRSRFLLDQIAGGSPTATPLDAAGIARRVDKGAALVEITLIDQAAVVWLISDGHIAQGRSTANRNAIETVATQHLQALHAGNDAEMRRTGKWLFNELLGPVVQQLPKNADLIISPDAVLQSFPFATLIDPNGRFLMERQPLLTVPSASFLLRVRASQARDSLLAVAQSAPEGFAVLPEATREATEIARRHPHGRVAVGESITPQEFLESAARVSLVQFSGHATTDPTEPFRSSLIFESRKGVTRLTAEVVAKATLDSHPFVILAACSTGRGRLRHNEGVDSIANAFLQAGASGVAATLWDIDDAESSRLFRSFHENLRTGARACDALRSAQASFLHSTNKRDRSPDIWGSVTLIGKP